MSLTPILEKKEPDILEYLRNRPENHRVTPNEWERVIEEYAIPFLKQRGYTEVSSNKMFDTAKGMVPLYPADLKELSKGVYRREAWRCQASTACKRLVARGVLGRDRNSKKFRL